MKKTAGTKKPKQAITTEELAEKPPKTCPEGLKDIWRTTVFNGNHTDFGGALAHFRRHINTHREEINIFLMREYGKTLEDYNM